MSQYEAEINRKKEEIENESNIYGESGAQDRAE